MIRYAALLLLAGLAATGAVACVSGEPAPETATALAGTRWACVSIEGEPVEAGAEVWMHWQDDGEVGGYGGVNRWFGSWKSGGGASVTFSGVGSTRRGGPPELMKQETRFLDALALVEQAYRIDGGLQLFGRGRLLLEFRPQS